ncbi:MAG: CaiB/BaiF CoA-transferase family protein [Thermodesulfobacteriota bacterium]|nr:CaiB/BaiF CoA-transferase family protein [Thermodesulfobacteriota bacterium]
MRALEGIKVLDLSRLFPGPYCSMILADLGAEVLRIEDRRFEGEGPGMPTVMRNKRHMTLNLKHPRGREIFYRLVKDADVVLEGFRPGVTERLGIDYERMKEINERLIYCSVTGYGQDGPYKDMVGHDINYLSFGGVLGLTGEPGRKPVIPPIQVADMAAGGMYAALGIMAALIARQKTGKGQYIDISMLDGIVAMLPFLVSLLWGQNITPQKSDTILSGRYPCYQVYETKDGEYISLGALEHRFWVALCQKFKREDYIQHQYAEGEKRQEIFIFLRAIFKSKTREEWMEELKDLDICFGKVLHLDEALHDPQVKQRKMVLEFSDPQKGNMKILASPIKLSATPPDIRLAPARFGEHTVDVLKELGYEELEIEGLKREGVI